MMESPCTDPSPPGSAAEASGTACAARGRAVPPEADPLGGRRDRQPRDLPASPAGRCRAALHDGPAVPMRRRRSDRRGCSSPSRCRCSLDLVTAPARSRRSSRRRSFPHGVRSCPRLSSEGANGDRCCWLLTRELARPAPFWRAPHVPRVRPSRGALDGDLAEIVIPKRRGSCGTRGQLPAGRREGRDPDAVPEQRAGCALVDRR